MVLQLYKYSNALVDCLKIFTSSGFSEVIRVAITCPLGLGQFTGLRKKFTRLKLVRYIYFIHKGMFFLFKELLKK